MMTIKKVKTSSTRRFLNEAGVLRFSGRQPQKKKLTGGMSEQCTKQGSKEMHRDRDRDDPIRH